MMREDTSNTEIAKRMEMIRCTFGKLKYIMSLVISDHVICALRYRSFD